ncbi:MAG: indole-3-glycerol phosphate synthase TrpC [Lachnospiraceae bacterium]|nr:indole-3-glycerol phosphate synthase TrpC [Lachnospiraceae bacterium]
MSDILDKLADHARERVKRASEIISPSEIKERAMSLSKGMFEFENALKKEGLSFICECKKASPSKGIIAEDFPYLDIAKAYETAGADCISVLTEPKWFLGSDEYLREIAANVSTPCIRKDFTVSDYMIYEAKILGAKAVLLICAILDDRELAEYIKICDELGLSALVEAHDGEEIKRALNAGARIVGVNNRNLKDFTVDISNAGKLRDMVPKNVIYVSESGIKDKYDIKNAHDMGADAVLIGETLMRAADKKQMLDELKSLL